MTCFTGNLEEIIYKAESIFFKMPLLNSLGGDSAMCVSFYPVPCISRSLVSVLQTGVYERSISASGNTMAAAIRKHFRSAQDLTQLTYL